MNMIRLVSLYSAVLLEYIFVVFGEENYEFSSPQTTVKAQENNTVLLPCYLNTLSTGSDFSNTVRWYHDNELIADNEQTEFFTISDRQVMHNNGSLEITRVEPNDTGEYMCEVIRNQPWSTVRQFHAIEVLQAPTVVPDPISRHVKVRLGQLVKFSCKGNGVPYPLITWKRNGEDMQLLDNREMLKFVASNRSLAGYYECIANNGVGEPASAFIELNIVYPPELTTSSNWIHTAVGHTAQMDCKVTANPSAHIIWMKKDVTLPYDRRIFRKDYAEGNSDLFIKNVQTSDFGIYACLAINDEGEQELQIELSGLPNPAIFKTNLMKEQESTTSYTLIWEVFSFTPVIEYSLLFREYMPNKDTMRYDWTKLTIPAEYSSNGVLHSMLYTIRGLKEKSRYEALLMSRNKYGWSKPSPILRFATKGADLKDEEMTTLVTVEPEVTNFISLDFSGVVNRGNRVHVNCIITILLIILVKTK